MADNIDVDPGTGAAKVPVRTIDRAGVDTQVMALDIGGAGGEVLAVGTAARGLPVDPRLRVVRRPVTPVISTTAYTAKDAVGSLMTFAGAARVAGGAIRVDSVQVVDLAQQMRDLDLVLFDRAITAPVDNAAFDPTDAEVLYCIGVVPIFAGHYSDLFDNSVATIQGIGLAAVLNGTDLVGVLVARGTPTYVSTGDLTVTVTVTQLD